LRQSWKNLSNFFAASIHSKDFVEEHKWRNDLIQLVNNTRQNLMEIRLFLFAFIQELDDMLYAIGRDKFFKEAAGSVRKLGSDLFYDSRGNLKFNKSGLEQIQKLILPELQERFKFLALPTICGKDETLEYEITNAVLRTSGLTPDEIVIRNSNHLRLLPEEQLGNFRSSFYVLVRRIKLDAEDMHLKYKRFTFPKIEDEGTFNVRADGGLTLELWLSSSDDRTFHVDDVECSISGLTVYDMDFEKHQTLYTIFKPIFEMMIRRRAEYSIEENLKNASFNLQRVGSSLTSIVE